MLRMRMKTRKRDTSDKTMPKWMPPYITKASLKKQTPKTKTKNPIKANDRNQKSRTRGTSSEEDKFHP